MFHVKRGDITSSGLDWLTFTAVTQPYVESLYYTSRMVYGILKETGYRRKDWSAMGYNGFSAGPLKYGERNKVEAIMILSGEAADVFGFRPKLEIDRVTRTDVQVTVRVNPPIPNAAYLTHQNLQARYKDAKKRPFLSLLQSTTGETLYVGKRDGEVSLRFYDKSNDMGEAEQGTCWRYEVQYRRKKAKAAYGIIRKHTEPHLASIGLVGAEFKKRHIIPGFGSKSDITAIEMGRVVATTDGQLKWLEKCVAPVISQLVMAGFEEQVYSSLNLGAVINAVQRSKEWQ